MNTFNTKFGHLLQGESIDTSDKKCVDKESLKLIVNLEGKSYSDTPWNLKLSFQFMEFNENMFCIRVTKVKGCQFQMNLQLRVLQQEMKSVLINSTL